MAKILQKEQDKWHVVSSIVFVGLITTLISILHSRGEVPHNIPVFDLFVLSVATFRLIRLFTYDSVMSWIRDYFGQFDRGPKKAINSLLSCPWCSGTWMAILVAYLYFLVPLSWPFLIVLALAGLGSFIQIVIWRIGVEPPWYKED
jgi:hypothetical protein